MPTAEPDFELAEEITVEPAQAGSLTEQQAQRIDLFYRNVESRMLNLYDATRLGTWRILRFQKTGRLSCGTPSN